MRTPTPNHALKKKGTSPPVIPAIMEAGLRDWPDGRSDEMTVEYALCGLILAKKRYSSGSGGFGNIEPETTYWISSPIKLQRN